jgi:hypothetical protein
MHSFGGDNDNPHHEVAMLRATRRLVLAAWSWGPGNDATRNADIAKDCLQ